MRIQKASITSPRPHGPTASPLALAKTALLQQYATSDATARQFFFDLVLEHAFLFDGLAPYGKWTQENVPVRSCYFLLSEVSVPLADAWYDFAYQMQILSMSVADRHVHIYMLVKAFVTEMWIEHANVRWQDEPSFTPFASSLPR